MKMSVQRKEWKNEGGGKEGEKEEEMKGKKERKWKKPVP